MQNWYCDGPMNYATEFLSLSPILCFLLQPPSISVENSTVLKSIHGIKWEEAQDNMK